MNVEAATDPFAELMLEFYRVAAPVYDDWAGGVHRKTAARLAQLAHVQPHDVVVDAGCGTGLVTRMLGSDGRRAARIVGVDISQDMLEVAQANSPIGTPVVFGRGVVEDLVLRDETVDVVILGLVLHDTADPAAVLTEARRVLRSGGRVAVSVPRHSLITETDSLFVAEMRDAATIFRIPERPASHAQLGEPQMLRAFVEECGFISVETSSMVVGNHTEDAASFIELMRYENAWMHTMVQMMGPVARQKLEHRLTGTVRFSAEGGPFRYHLPFSFAVGRKPRSHERVR